LPLGGGGGKRRKERVQKALKVARQRFPEHRGRAGIQSFRPAEREQKSKPKEVKERSKRKKWHDARRMSPPGLGISFQSLHTVGLTVQGDVAIEKKRKKYMQS